MDIQVVSDLHLEMMGLSPEAQVAVLDRGLQPEAPILVVAGDLTSKSALIPCLESLALRWEAVVYVLGNHEYYRANSSDLHATLRGLGRKRGNFHWLDNSGETVLGQPFFGGIMWYQQRTDDYQYHGLMSDYRCIPRLGSLVERGNGLFRLGFGDVAEGAVVVSHHLPLPQSTPPQFKDSPLNRFFVSDMAREIEATRPKVWVHGHTHEACDYQYADTRIVCNPLGYRGERTGFHPSKVVSV